MLVGSRPFDKREKRLELLERLNKIPGLVLPEESIDKYPSFPMSLLVNKSGYMSFIESINWLVEEIEKNN